MLGLFIGYHTFAGGGWGSDDLELIDLQELQEAESRQDVYVKRFKWQEIIVEKDGHGKFKYPAQVKGFSQPAGKKNQYPLKASDEEDEELGIFDDGLEGSVAGPPVTSRQASMKRIIGVSHLVVTQYFIGGTENLVHHFIFLKTASTTFLFHESFLTS